MDGKFKGLPKYEQKLWEIKSGGRTTMVAHVVVWSPHGERGHLCRGLQYRQFFRLKAAIPKGCEKFTVFNAVVTHSQGPNLTLDASSAIIGHEPREADDYFRMVELCTGLGALGTGAKAAGWKIEAQNEIQHSFCEHLRKCGSTTVVEGDLCKLSTVLRIHEMAPKAGTMSWGFSCQPFSKLGDQQHGSDPRAQTLPYGLYASYLLQKDLLVLECVPQAASSQFVQQCLAYHIEMTRAEKSETLLELSQMWPAARRRWWCVLMHESFPKINFREFPSLPQKPTIQQLLPDWVPLTPDELQQLTLTSTESQAFISHKPGLAKQMVNQQDVLPTALHSWGNQCQPCKCGCRPAFSDARLADHGLYGAIVSVPGVEEDSNLRHIAPKEMALLCGYPKTDGWQDEQRLLMAGIGQLASPIQAAWIFGHIRELLHEYQFGVISAVHPRQIVACVCLEVIKLRDEWFPNHGNTVAMSLFQESIGNMLEHPKGSNLSSATNTALPIVPNSATTSGGTEPESSQTTTESNVNGQPGLASLDQLDQAILAQVGQQNSPPKEQVEKKRKEIPGAVIGFRLEDQTTKVAKTEPEPRQRQSEAPPGASHVLDRWCTNHGGVEEAKLPSTEHGADAIPTSEQPAATVKTTSPMDHTVLVKPGCGVQPADILEAKVLVWDRDNATIMSVACSPGTTGGDLLQATHKIDGRKTMVLYDMLGQTLDLTHKLEPGQIVGIGGRGDPQPDLMTCQQVEQWLAAKPRWFAALQQGARVAHDEMYQYLGAISSRYNIAFAMPLLLGQWEDAQIQEWKTGFKPDTVTISAIVVGGHWIPIIARHDEDRIITTTEQGLSLCTNLFPADKIVQRPDIETQFLNDCGFQTLAWIIAEIEHQDTISYFTHQQACEWRQLFWHRVFLDVQSQECQPLILGGHDPELVIAISTLLKEHGVDAEHLQDRAQTMITKLGSDSIKEALQSSRPWQKLKRLANDSSPPFRLIAPEELDRILAEKAKAGKSIGNRSSKAPRIQAQAPVSIGPQDIIIPTGVFAQDDGTLMPQLQVRQIGPQVKGVIVVQESEAQPYLNSGCISNEGLAFIVLNPSRELQDTPGQLIRFPAQCATTGEPILVSAFVIQKGKKSVQRAIPSNLPKVDEVPVSTIKILVFRDQLPMGWTEFCEAPVKHTIALVRCLQICNTPGCDCEQWHPSTNQTAASAEPILDIWNRDFLTYGFKKTPAKEAQMFVCAVRVQASAFDKLCAFSGTDGVYIEPRSSDGRTHDSKYHTVWLPKSQHKEAIAAKAISTTPTILVRVQNRYELKVAMEQASQIHEQFRGDTVFLGGQDKVLYTVGPMPWGASRASLTAVFKTWDWQAKPIQAIHKSADKRGLVWSVQAMQPPPSSVVTMEHGDVLIVRKDPEQEKHAPPPTIEASVRTKQSLQPQTSQVKPLTNDPWAEAARRLPSSTVPVAASMQQVAHIEKQVEQRLLEKLEKVDDPMKGTIEPRVAALETQIRQLQDAQTHQQKQNTQIAQQVTQVQGQVEQQTHKLQHHMDAKLAEQMTMIEALLNKRSRHE